MGIRLVPTSMTLKINLYCP